jgi:serine/threonine protein kinase
MHRDIKPPNILLFGSEINGVVKLGDFGIAKALDGPD